MEEQRAFTIRYNGISRVLKSKVGIGLPFLGDLETKQENISIKEFIGIWDTGATGSVVTKKVADDLQLKPIGKTIVHHAGGADEANVYLVNIALPNNVMVPNIRVTEGKLPEEGDANVLIGMDIISRGDFSVTNLENKTTFSFRMPSCEEIDYVPISNEANKAKLLAGMNRHQRRAFEARERRKER